ncbi:HAD family hydrolase [Aestuariibius sp. HNIBRBA575]|uniref:HAD family hydrolase n=1 Tax=Aestuariibius sp. HNIBRBA575 TaxID=3233343 RepID=UPI0034A36692
MIPKLVIFDCDGVLVDTEGPVSDIIASSLTRYGLPVSGAECQDLFIGGTMQGVYHEAKSRGATLPDTWVDDIYRQMFDRLQQGVPTIAGVMELIDQLEERGVSIWVASNGPMQKMQYSLGPTGLWDRWAGRILSRENHAPKPAPDMLTFALQQTGIDIRDAVMIDDSPTGCKSAQAIGMRCIGFAERGQDADLRAVGAEVAHTMDDVSALLGLDQ